ncbi:PDDEXK nuclease domain-containing protein [Mucilaginibacter terrae]|uniref:Nuclease of restriction endonuclease-like (RecB) superfamily n=1 Tax=Mucilaginibacter terrae TaxID=1955052 RepID=A0ABU3GRV2_9SPHI|nr:PDDEXK nuclease domain-containing protein [Mucilaginibacter terrae]MDT3402370.1 putative nuclease of restriction endonuclease-like (RecB) superfamily [Mucilaginibacter terrae]
MNKEKNYDLLLNDLRSEIERAKLKVALTVNSQLLELYWKIGYNILVKQRQEGWGAKVIDRLARDLSSLYPDMKGISPRNLKYMRAFAEAYPEFVQAPPAQIQERGQIVQAPLAQLPWYHHITLLDKIKNIEERYFYIAEAVRNGWSRNVLVHQIEGRLFSRRGAATTNFSATLDSMQNDLAQEVFKDPYKFDFLSIATLHSERDLENGLVSQMTKLLMELGRGFSYVGRQYPLTVGGENFFIDLLFYHLKLRCFVVIELKTGKFIPEYAGKLNFYLNAVDSQLKHNLDLPAIGILICKEKNKVITEYALKGVKNPIGVAEYQITHLVPDNLKDSFPTIAQIEDSLL